eukprot:272314-Rhodomonas_salina.2
MLYAAQVRCRFRWHQYHLWRYCCHKWWLSCAVYGSLSAVYGGSTGVYGSHADWDGGAAQFSKDPMARHVIGGGSGSNEARAPSKSNEKHTVSVQFVPGMRLRRFDFAVKRRVCCALFGADVRGMRATGAYLRARERQFGRHHARHAP